MSGPTDLLRRIADARAQMLMRGHQALRLEIGATTARQFAEESQITDPADWVEAIWRLPIRVRSDMEGFAVLSALA